jgi:hypothetical protein
VPFGEQLKSKADEVNLQVKAKEFGDAVFEVAKAAVSLAASYAQDNRDKVDGALDKAESTIGHTVGGKHAGTVSKVRASVDKGIDRLVEQRDKAATGPSAPSAPTSVPDDKHSAFDDDSPAGNPS